MTLDELLALIEAVGTDDAPTDEELASAREELRELLVAALDQDSPDLNAGADIREAIDAIDAEVAARIAAEEETRAEAARLLEGLIDTDDTDDTESEEVAEAQPEPVAAASAPRTLGSALRNANRARVEANAVPENANPNVRVRTLGVAQGEVLTNESGIRDIARLFTDNASAVKNGRQVLVRSEVTYPENRVLGLKADENAIIMDQVFAERQQAIGAAGGICEPIPADRNHLIVGDRGRPIRNALPRLTVPGGGIRYAPTLTLDDFSGGITHWDIATDESPGDAVKACPHVECEDELTAKVDAVVACLTVGNFAARFNTEQWRAALELLGRAHDREAEQILYAKMAGDATAVTYGGPGTGTIQGVLNAIDKGVAGISSRLRYMSPNFRAIMPTWVRRALRAHVASQRLGSSPADALTVADTVINGWFSARGVTPIWSPDIDIFGAQTTGALLDFPGADADILLFHEGDYVFLDGGTLDLGTEITDSTLNSKNDRQAFWETFETVIRRGVGPLEIEVPVEELCICPDVAVLDESPA